jgi:DNA polymerase-3 subunit beta
MRTLPLEGFPDRRVVGDKAARFSLDAHVLREMLQEVRYASDPKSGYLYARGVCLHVGGGRLTAVATDHHRLAMQSAPMPSGAADMPPIIVPTEAVVAIIDLLEDGAVAELAVTEALLEVSVVPGARLTTALIGGVFPASYEKVIPPADHPAMSFRPYAMSEAVERAAVVHLGQANPNKLAPIMRLSTGDGVVQLRAGVAGNEEADEVVEADTNGHQLSLSVNASYLAQMLRVWPEDSVVGVHQAAADRAILFAAADRPHVRHVLMPTNF